jgi:hypothetical protein
LLDGSRKNALGIKEVRNRSMNNAYRTIPKVDAVLGEPVLADLPYSPELIKRAVQKAIEKARSRRARTHPGWLQPWPRISHLSWSRV